MATTTVKLKPKQERFCELYASSAEFFGNGAQSYIEAYGIHRKDYNTAKVNASKLLTNPNILKRIDELLEAAVLNDEFVDKQLAFLITQNAELGVKVKAIGEYNKLRARITHLIPGKGDGDGMVTSITYYPKALPRGYYEHPNNTTDNNSK